MRESVIEINILDKKEVRFVMRQVTEVKEIQAMALELLRLLDQFCAERCIEYYLAYGTLLGAVRHGGFIPWDDDIDVWVKRADYDRILAEFPEWGKSRGVFLNSPKTVAKTYNRIHSQICRADTKLIARDRVNDYVEGCFIDIFPIDGAPNNPVLRWLRMTHLQILKDIGTAAAYKVHENASAKAKLIGAAASVLRRLNTSKLMDRYGKVAAASDYDASAYVQVAYMSLHGRNKLLRRELFDKTTQRAFETMTASVPAEYDRVLTELYGDYRKLPPVEKRVTHHDYDLFLKDE